jgi:hypothetical protein
MAAINGAAEGDNLEDRTGNDIIYGLAAAGQVRINDIAGVDLIVQVIRAGRLRPTSRSGSATRRRPAWPRRISSFDAGVI